MRNVKGHVIRWYATDKVNGKQFPRASWMQNGDYFWTATCSCGREFGEPETNMPTVDRDVIAHKAEAFAATERPAVVLPAPVQTKTPFTLEVEGQSTVFSRKDRAVAAGEKTGLPFTVTNPKGTLVHRAI